MATYTYTTAAMVQAELQSSTEFSSSTTPTLATINSWIEEESAMVNHDAGRIFGINQYTVYVDYDGEEVIMLEQSPLVQVDSLKYNKNTLGSDSGEDWETEVEDDDYTVYTDTGEVVLLLDRFSPNTGRKRLEIIYTAGYTELPLTVQKLTTKMVTLRVLDTLLAKNMNEGNDGGSVQVGSIRIVEPADYGVGRYQQLKSDIYDLKNTVSKGFGVHRYTNYYG